MRIDTATIGGNQHIRSLSRVLSSQPVVLEYCGSERVQVFR